MVRRLLATTAALGVLLAPLAAPRAQDALTEAQRAQFESVIKDYLMKNPEVIEEAMAALEKKRADEQAEARRRLISEQSSILINSARQAEMGNRQGDVTVVEFFDYNCGFCKRGLADTNALLETDKKVRYVLKEFPVLGPGSVEAAQVSIAVNRIAPDKHAEFHNKLLGGRGQANKARALEVAKEVGIDVKKVEAALADPEVAATIEENYALANGLGLTGTPTYVIGNDVVPGAVGLEALKKRIEDIRKCGANTTAC
jgi:protein-disulfide isomerase